MLSSDEAEVQLVSRDNFLLFTPMLHEIAASDLDITTVVNRIRGMVRRTHFMQADVQTIDLETRNVVVVHGMDRHVHRPTFDHLVIAMGATLNFLGLPGVKARAMTMRTLEDAIVLRSRMIAHLEEADPDCAANARGSLLTMVVVGGGFADVETVAGMRDFLESAICSYPNLHSSMLRLVLVHSALHLLPELGERLGHYTEKKLRARGIEVMTQQRMTSATETGVTLASGQFISTTFVIWTSGNAAPPQVAALACANAAGRLETDRLLQVISAPDVWALGDCAVVPDGASGIHPATAQHAFRQAKSVAANITATLRGGTLQPFAFTTIGQLASIGRRMGVAQIMGRRFSGFLAWWMWRTIYLVKLPSSEKRLHVALNWTLDLLFAKDTVQYMSFRAMEKVNVAASPLTEAVLNADALSCQGATS